MSNITSLLLKVKSYNIYNFSTICSFGTFFDKLIILKEVNFVL